MDYLHALDLDDVSWTRSVDLERITKRAIRDQYIRNDNAIRTMLSGWASELEPSIAIGHQGEVIGLCCAGDPTGTLVMVWRPVSARENNEICV